MASTPKRHIRAIAWDPESPATLLLPVPTPTAVEAGEEGASQELLRVDRFLSHDGVGCNAHETSALMRLLDAQEEYFANDEKQGEWTAVKHLSKSYRLALRDCLRGWVEELKQQSQAENIDSNEEVNLELLKVVYAVSHLSEIYLLLPPSTDFEDYSTMQGAVTADTVRYLRLHHMADPYSTIESSLVDQMLESPQPEQFDVYWTLVQTLVMRGCLDDAWALLSHHSICRRSFAEPSASPLDEYHAATMEEDRNGFLALQAVLLSAPLPGGRTDSNDAGLDIVSDEDNQEHGTLLDGLPRSAYKLWETIDASTDSDFPVSYNPHAAIAAHKTWKQYVTNLAPLYGLTRRIPQLQTVLGILQGKFQNVVFASWSEALCAELLYLHPGYRLDDMHVRTARVMEKFGVTTQGGFNEVILSVMKGNAGRVIQVLHDLGGGSGAALPATMTALLCNLLTEAKLIPPFVSSPEPSSFCIQTELLLSASFAILSSLSSKQRDVGVRLSTRLLLPYARPDGDVRIAATIGETLDRHAPQSDAEARILLSLCRKLVERKSVRVLDGCVSLILYRYRHYLADKRPGGAIHWLLKGIEFETMVFRSNDEGADQGVWQLVLASGACGMFLSSSCVTASQSLLKGLLDSNSVASVGRDFTTAKEIVTAIREDEMSAFARMIPEVKLLFHVFDIAQAIVAQEGDEILAGNIVACLEETANDDDDDGVVSVLAHPSMHEDLLSLAHAILNRDEGRYNDGGSVERFKSSFDVNGIHILLGRFTQLSLQKDGEENNMGGMGSAADEAGPMRLALCKGLARAFVSENAGKHMAVPESSLPMMGGVRSAKLASYGRPEQERAIELMLDPSM